MTAPKFLRVIPAEIERYGANAAIVLAHIRFRCNTDGDGRIERNDHRWWRASRSVIASEVRLSVKAVRKALQDLEGTVEAEHFPPLSDQSLAYRVVTAATELTSQKPHRAPADQPEAPQGNPDAPQGTVPCPVGQGTVPHRASAPLYVELEEGVRTHTPRSPSKFCDIHPQGTRQPCGDCANARTAFGAWQAHAAAVDLAIAEADDLHRRRRRKLIDSCDDCDDAGRLDDLSPCTHPNSALRVGHG